MIPSATRQTLAQSVDVLLSLTGWIKLVVYHWQLALQSQHQKLVVNADRHKLDLRQAVVKTAAAYRPSSFGHVQWLVTQISHQYGAGEGDGGRLRELCTELLGPGQPEQAEIPGWSSTVCGLDKRKLLQDEVLKRLGDKHLSIRRVKAEFWEQLSAMQEQ